MTPCERMKQIGENPDAVLENYTIREHMALMKHIPQCATCSRIREEVRTRIPKKPKRLYGEETN